MADRKTPLRAVSPNEKPTRRPAPRKPKTVTEAAESGTTRELMVAMRARIAKAVEDPTTPARDLAALTKRHAEVVAIIEAIDAREAHDANEAGAQVEDGEFDASAV